MFLRKLHRLHVTTPRSDKIYQRIRNEFDPDFGGETMTIQTCQGGHLVCQTKYIVQRHNVADLPADARRNGVETSEIMVAFPVQDEATPIVANQKAFAFLPVDDFGFRVRYDADIDIERFTTNLIYSFWFMPTFCLSLAGRAWNTHAFGT